MDAKIIEEKIYAATGRMVDGKSILEEIQRAAGNSEETGSVWLTGEDSLKERWDYWVDLTRKTDIQNWKIINRSMRICTNVQNKDRGCMLRQDMNL